MDSLKQSMRYQSIFIRLCNNTIISRSLDFPYVYMYYIYKLNYILEIEIEIENRNVSICDSPI